MTRRGAVTIRAAIIPDRLPALTSLLEQMSGKGADNGYLPFRELDGVHFARLFVIPDAIGASGWPVPASLVYMSDIDTVDTSAAEHIADLVRRAGPGLDTVFGHCRDYPDPASGGWARARWLRERMVTGATTYVHTAGRSVRQVHDEARLRTEIEDFLDRPQAIPAGADAAEVHRLVRQYVGSRPDLRWALRPAPGPGLVSRVRDGVHRVAVPAALVLALPVAVPAAAILLVAIRRQERQDRSEPAVPTSEHLREVERYEDFAAQNPFTGVGVIKPGPVRRLTISAALAGLGYTMRHWYARDNLAGVRTIHFARWLPIDGGTRLIFASSYDGSLESYMDDFVDRLAWGLNLIFGNGVGYPATRWLLGAGARQEQAFKRFLRVHQLPTPVWYSAYEALTARNIDANGRLRAGLARPLVGTAADEWLSLL